MRIFVLLAMLYPAALWSQAKPSYSSAAERELLTLERVVKLQACETKDLKTLDEMLDDGFVYIDPEGKYYSKADLLTLVRTADFLHYVTESMGVRAHGNTAIVTGLYEIKLVLHGNPSLERGRFVDTWVLENGQWKAIASITVPATDSRTN